MRATTFLAAMLAATLAAAPELLSAGEPPGEQSPAALAPPEVQAGVEDVVRRTSAMYGDVKGPQAIQLFDRIEPMPMYLATKEPAGSSAGRPSTATSACPGGSPWSRPWT